VTKSIDETKKSMEGLAGDGERGRHYRGLYFVHRILEGDSGREGDSERTELVGRVSFRPEKLFPLPAKFTVPSGPGTEVLCLEFGYAFLTGGWGQGFATEALRGVLDGLQGAKAFLDPFTKLYVEAIVAPENPRSIRVLEKVGMERRGVYEWEGENVFLNGAWREPRVLVYGQWLAE
jgi:RimJ/RimL family protein N-acetyltransferase